MASNTYTQILNLDELDVYYESDPNNSEYFEVQGIKDNVISYGKHLFTIGYNDPEETDLLLKEDTQVLFEFKDSRGIVIWSDIADLSHIGGSAVGYLWLKKNPLRTHDEIADGSGTMTIVGELENVPPKWKDKYNIRLVIPFEIRKNISNTSPVVFQTPNIIQISSSFSESIHLDTNDPNYKRSYLNISASHLHTYGGKVDSVELSYREVRAKNNEYKVLTTYPLSSSIYELSDTGSVNGLNPISDLQKFPVPRDIRRNGSVEFRLRFLNSNGEFSQDITQNNINVQVTGSITGFTGSAVILETDDNLVTGSGKLIFGKSLSDGVHMVPGLDKAGRRTINYELHEGGTKTKNVFTIGENIASDDERNIVNKSSGSAILGSIEGIVSQSNFSTIVGGISGSITRSPLSMVVGGNKGIIDQSGSFLSDIGANIIIGGSVNRITGSSTFNTIGGAVVGGGLNKVTANSEVSNFGTIIGGYGNDIFGGNYNVVIGGQSQTINNASSRAAIVGGSGNTIDGHTDAVIIGMTNKTSTADDTVYVENLSVDGTGSFGRLETTVVSASIIYASGSNIFGDAISDTHLFNGHITASGNISASGTIRAEHFYSSDDIVANDVIQAGSFESTAGGLTLDGGGLVFASAHDISTVSAIDWDIIDNNASALSWDASGKAGILEIDSTNNSEQVKMSGGLIVTGNITGSNNISASGNINASTFNGSLTGDVTSSGIFLPNDDSKITFKSDDTYIYGSDGAGAVEDLYIGADDDIKLQPDDNVEIQHGTTTYATFQGDERKLAVVGSGSFTQNVSIGTATIGVGNQLLTVAGDISASGFIFLQETGSAFQGVDGDGAGYLFASSSGQLCYQSGSTVASVIALGAGGGDGGSGTVTSIVAGDGLNGGTITSTGTISVDSASMGGFYSASMNDFTTTGFIKGNHITASGNISASGELNATELHLVKASATTNEKLLSVTVGTTEKAYIDEDGDIQGDGGLTMGGSVKGNGYFYGTDNDSSLQISSTGHRIRVNDGTQVVAWFDDDQISLAPGSQDVDLKIGASGLGGFFDYGTTNFGVGTITPSKKLTVHGDISSSGNVYANTGSFTQLTIPQDSSAGNPTLNFGDGNTGIYESSDNTLNFSMAGSAKWQMDGTAFTSGNTRGNKLMRVTGTATAPVYAINGDTDTGIGSSAANNLSLITGGVESLRLAGTVISGSATSTLSIGGQATLGGINSTSHITASGNISASGTLIANAITLPNDSISGDLIEGGTIGSTTITALAGNISIGDNNITNVGEISVDKIIADGDADVTIQLDTNGYSFNLGEKDKDFKYYDSEETELIHGDAGLSRVGIYDSTPVSTLDVGGDLNVQSHITASGNISSSGTVTAEHFHSSDDAVITDTLTVGTDVLTTRHGLFGGNVTVGTQTAATNMELTVTGDISASGGFFVSSSGNVMINSDNTGSMATHLGAFSVNYGNHTQLTGSLAVNGDGYGDIVKIGGTTTVKAQMYYLDTDSTWTLSNATDDSAGADKLLAIALGTNSDIDGMLLKGFTKLNAQGTTVVGAPIYMNTSDGNTTFAPNDTSAEIVRIVGYCLTGGEEMYFNPDSTFVEVA